MGSEWRALSAVVSRATFVFLGVFLLLLVQSKRLFEWMTFLSGVPAPFKRAHGFIATDVTAVVMVPMKLAFFISLIICLPYFFLEVWHFVSPGLYARERKLWGRWLFISVLFFYIGMGVAYFVFAPYLLHFFESLTPSSVELWLDIRHYQTFLIQLCLALGLIFQTPVLLKLGVQMGWVKLDRLSKSRRYVVVVALTLGMLLTPPDVLSQVLLALPIWGLFELTLLYLRWAQWQKEKPLMDKR